ncbi:MAG: hypothetical protein Q7R85_04215 [bacterium]|nr:hypothetical protein [bacterium]
MFIKKYIAYAKDNPYGYWFKAKPYGWGWTPVRWQGWLTLLVFIGLMVLNFFRIDAQSYSVSDTVRPFVIQNVILVIILLAVCWKTGERPRWMWGLPDPNESKKMDGA